MAKQSIKDKTVKGIGWSAVDNITQHLVTFVVGIVMARHLFPKENIGEICGICLTLYLRLNKD